MDFYYFLDSRPLREREREREQLINGITNKRTNNLTNIEKDERTNGKTKTIHPSTLTPGVNASVDLDI